MCIYLKRSEIESVARTENQLHLWTAVVWKQGRNSKKEDRNEKKKQKKHAKEMDKLRDEDERRRGNNKHWMKEKSRLHRMNAIFAVVAATFLNWVSFCFSLFFSLFYASSQEKNSYLERRSCRFGVVALNVMLNCAVFFSFSLFFSLNSFSQSNNCGISLWISALLCVTNTPAFILNFNWS